MSSKARLRDAYSIPTVSYVHHFPVSAGVWSRPDTRGAITSATTRYERMSDKVNLRGSACTIAGTPGRKQDMVRHLRITNFRYVYCSLPHSCSRAHTRGTKTLFLRELLGLTEDYAPTQFQRFFLNLGNIIHRLHFRDEIGLRICRHMVLKLSKYLYGIWAPPSLSMGNIWGVWVD